MDIEIRIPDDPEQRGAPRRETRLHADVRHTGTVRTPAVIHDLSTTGFRIESQERLPVDSVVWVRIPPLSPLMARVKWSKDYMAGCAFETPLHAAVLDHIIRSGS